MLQFIKILFFLSSIQLRHFVKIVLMFDLVYFILLLFICLSPLLFSCAAFYPPNTIFIHTYIYLFSFFLSVQLLISVPIHHKRYVMLTL